MMEFNRFTTTFNFCATLVAPKTGATTATMCGGGFAFGGAEADAGVAGAFTGAIYEADSVDGNSWGSLNEAWLGGKGPVVGLVRLGRRTTQVSCRAYSRSSALD
jgi:hypothetical protein